MCFFLYSLGQGRTMFILGIQLHVGSDEGGEPEILLRTGLQGEKDRCGPAFMSIKATACVTINIIMQEGDRAGK